MSIVDDSFYTQLLAALGAPASVNNLRSLRAWQQAEGGGATFNPFNTTQDAPGAVPYNDIRLPSGVIIHVFSYPTAQVGLNATLQTLQNGNYQPILDALKASAPPLQTTAAIDASPWGTSGAEGLIKEGAGKTGAPAGSSGFGSGAGGFDLASGLGDPKAPGLSDLADPAAFAGKTAAVIFVPILKTMIYLAQISAGLGLIVLGVLMLVWDKTPGPLKDLATSAAAPELGAAKAAKAAKPVAAKPPAAPRVRSRTRPDNPRETRVVEGEVVR